MTLRWRGLLPSVFFIFSSFICSPLLGGAIPSPNYSLTGHAADLCGARFRNLAVALAGQMHITHALIDTQGDTKRTMSFVELYGLHLYISDNNLVAGQPAHFSGPKTEENDGSFNHGIFYYTGPNGPQVIKLVSEVPSRGRPLTNEQKLAVARIGRGLEGAILGESTDAPKVYRFGTATYRGKQYYYVDMERAFAGEPSVVLKNTLRRGQSEETLNSRAKPLLATSMANHFVEAFDQQICPSDPDFIIGAQGQTRWIDPFAWKARLWKNTTQRNPDRGKNGTSFTHFMDLLSERNPQLAKDFMQAFLVQLKRYETLTTFEKYLLLEDLFLAQHHHDPVMEKLLRLYMQRIGVTSSERQEPLSAILRIYDAIP